MDPPFWARFMDHFIDQFHGPPVMEPVYGHFFLSRNLRLQAAKKFYDLTVVAISYLFESHALYPAVKVTGMAKTLSHTVCH